MEEILPYTFLRNYNHQRGMPAAGPMAVALQVPAWPDSQVHGRRGQPGAGVGNYNPQHGERGGLWETGHYRSMYSVTFIQCLRNYRSHNAMTAGHTAGGGSQEQGWGTTTPNVASRRIMGDRALKIHEWCGNQR